MNNYRISNSANSPVQLNMEAEVTTPQRTAKRNVRFAVRLPKRGGRKLTASCRRRACRSSPRRGHFYISKAAVLPAQTKQR